jgi:3-hydroxybutyryl-CoA dehydrogenase
MTYRLDSATPVAVIGAGTMGAGIAQLAAQSEHPVRLFDWQAGAAEAAHGRIAAELERAVSRGRLETTQRTAILSRIEVVKQIEELAVCGLAIEAIIERLDAKQSLLGRLEAILPPEAVLATNTSSISITAVAQALKHRQRFLGWHFFNPATRMKLVEVIAGLDTDPALVSDMQALSARWGKTALQAPNTPGFLVNRVARPYYAEGLRLLAEHIAPIEGIDTLLRESAGFPMGPFELMDLIGVDVNLSVTESVFVTTAFDSRYAPHWIQQELVRAGRTGRKAGKGFYDYVPPSSRASAARLASGTVPAELQHAGAMGLLAPLLDRLQAAGMPLSMNPALPAESLEFDGTRVMLSDGRTATECAAARGGPVLVLDLALDYARTSLVGAAASAGAESQLSALAALLAPAGIALLALADVAGLVVLRTVCCLASEAADVMNGAGVSAQDIDGAMTLATAYPKGPLAWADALGPTRIVQVLTHLQAHYGDTRYRRSPALSRLHFARGTFHG